MPRGKGTYGKQVGRPSSKKKKLDKYQNRGENTGSFFSKVSGMAKKALAQKQLDEAKARAAIKSATGQFDSGSDSLMEMEMLSGKPIKGTGNIADNPFVNVAPPKQPIEVKSIEEANKAAGKDVRGTIVDNFGMGGSVTNAKALRNNSRGKARKNR